MTYACDPEHSGAAFPSPSAIRIRFSVSEYPCVRARLVRLEAVQPRRRLVRQQRRDRLSAAVRGYGQGVIWSLITSRREGERAPDRLLADRQAAPLAAGAAGDGGSFLLAPLGKRDTG